MFHQILTPVAGNLIAVISGRFDAFGGWVLVVRQQYVFPRMIP